MKFPVNLATQPARKDRPILVASGAVGVFLMVTLVVLVSLALADRRRSADTRLLFGGRVNYSGLKSFDAPGATRARMLRVFPQLEGVRIDYAWGGHVDITLNRAPHFGRLAPNVYFLQGFSGHGIALTGIAGNNCVLVTANDAYMRDFKLFVPADCVVSNSNEENQAALKQMQNVLKADIRISTELDLQKISD